MDENIITWNFANVVTILFMILILWMIGGAIGHFVFRAPAQKPANQPFSGTASNSAVS